MKILKRMFQPAVTALIGGSWTDTISYQSMKLGYSGTIYRVHPTRESTRDLKYYKSVEELPEVPDCAVVAVDRKATVDVVKKLAAMGTGGAVCLASGFAETSTDEGRELETRLLEVSDAMPLLGPNCYGYINYVDRIGAWPDQIGSKPVESGVALISQSGTIAFTMMSNQRSLPISYLVSIGNQSKVKLHDLINHFISDERVTAIGMYIEGISDIEGFIQASNSARMHSVPLVAVKAGKSELAAKATQSHTNSLTGSDGLYDEMFRQLGVARCSSLSEFGETLKYLHVHGVREDARTIICGCSGGDMAMAADQSKDLPITLEPFTEQTFEALASILGPRVSISNPLDYHTYIWQDGQSLRAVFNRLRHETDRDAVALVLDLPDPKICDVKAFQFVLEQFIDSASRTASAASVISTLPETLGADIRELCLSNGIAPLQGMPEALRAIVHASEIGKAWKGGASYIDYQAPKKCPTTRVSLSEASAKRRLADAGVLTPRSSLVACSKAVEAAERIGYPVVMKVSRPDLLHKSNVGGVIVNIASSSEARGAVEQLSSLCDDILVEEMISDVLCELLIGIKVDSQFGQVLVIGAGGIFTELMSDTRQLLLPTDEKEIEYAIRSLRLFKMMDGYRGRPRANLAAVISLIAKLASFASTHAEELALLEINPLLVRPEGLDPVVVDAVMQGEFVQL